MLLCKIKDFSKKHEHPDVRSLTGLSVELTRRCNFKCPHCFLANPIQPLPPDSEWTSEEWVTLFDQYVDEGGLFLTVTGGEPLLRNDFQQLWVSMKKRGFLISLFTNGSLVDDDIVSFLSQWTPLEVSITLYGASEETYRKVTGRTGMFERVMHALEMVSKAGIPLEVKGVFSRLNIGEYSRIKMIAETYCDLFRWDVDLVGSFSSSSNTPQDIRLSPEECAELEAAEPIRNQELKNRFDIWNPPEADHASARVFHCGIGFNSAYIDSGGGLRPCLPLESVSYDLKSGTLKDGWHRAIPEMLRDFSHQPGPCQSCDGVELCGQCVAFAMLENCSATGPVPFKCRLAKERARKYGMTEKVSKIPDLQE